MDPVAEPAAAATVAMDRGDSAGDDPPPMEAQQHFQQRQEDGESSGGPIDWIPPPRLVATGRGGPSPSLEPVLEQTPQHLATLIVTNDDEGKNDDKESGTVDALTTATTFSSPPLWVELSSPSMQDDCPSLLVVATLQGQVCLWSSRDILGNENLIFPPVLDSVIPPTCMVQTQTPTIKGLLSSSDTLPSLSVSSQQKGLSTAADSDDWILVDSPIAATTTAPALIQVAAVPADLTLFPGDTSSPSTGGDGDDGGDGKNTVTTTVVVELVAVSTLGHVHLLKVHLDSSSTSTVAAQQEKEKETSAEEPSNKQIPSTTINAETVGYFETGIQSGLTTIAVVPSADLFHYPGSKNNKDDDDYWYFPGGAGGGKSKEQQHLRPSSATLVVGYQSGVVEQWQLVSLVRDNGDTKKPTTKSPKKNGEEHETTVQREASTFVRTGNNDTDATSWSAQLLWRGVLKDIQSGLPNPICSLQPLRPERTWKPISRASSGSSVSPSRRKKVTASEARLHEDATIQLENSSHRPHDKAGDDNLSPYLILTVKPPPPAVHHPNNNAAGSSSLSKSPNETADFVRVLSIASIMRAWEQQLQHQSINSGTNAREDGVACTDMSSTMTVSLTEHCISSTAGMELKINSPTNSTTWVPSRGTGCLCPLSFSSATMADTTENNSLQREQEEERPLATIAVGLSDGTVALVSTATSTPSLNAKKSLSWGIQQENNAHQLLLPYPPIGMGEVLLSPSPHPSGGIAGQRREPYVACCLRGGTVYLVPTPEPGTPESSSQHLASSGEKSGGALDARTSRRPVRAFSYPHEIDSSNNISDTVHYVQGFTAGNLVLLEDDRQRRRTVPIVVYAWASGIIDIYACELVQSRVVADRDATSLVLSELLYDGTVQKLVSFLCSCPDDAEILSAPEWAAARAEVLAFVNNRSNKEDMTSALSLDHPDVSEDDLRGLAGLRSLLLLLADTKRVDQGEQGQPPQEHVE